MQRLDEIVQPTYRTLVKPAKAEAAMASSIFASGTRWLVR
jgi:hypothetical protein